MSMRGKKGQVTIFVIVAVVIAVGVFGYYVVDSGFGGVPNYPEGVSTLRDNMVDCFLALDIEIIELTGIQGGYYRSIDGPREEFSDGLFIPYYFHDGERFVPSLAFIASEIEKGINENAASCLDDESITSPYDIRYGDISTDVRILGDEIVIVSDVDLYVTDSEKEHVISLNDYPQTISSDYQLMHEIASRMTEENGYDGDGVCLTCIDAMVQGTGVYVEFSVYDESLTNEAVIISDITEGHYPTSFEFLNKYAEIVEDESA